MVSDNNLDKLACAYERLHKDFLYLENEYQILLAEKEQMSRTIKDYQSLESEYQILLAEKEQMSRTIKDYQSLESEYQILLAEKEQMSCTIMEKNTTIWRMQIENERCRAENSHLSKESGQK